MRTTKPKKKEPTLFDEEEKPKTKCATDDFELIEGPMELGINGAFLYKGVAACYRNNKKDFTCVIQAPNMEQLHKAFLAISGNDLEMDEAKTKVIVGEYRKPIEEMIVKEKNKEKLYWYIHSESDCCFIEHKGYVSYDGCAELLGRAERMTQAECKILLRDEGWSKKDIEKLSISIGHPDDIPF